MAQKLKIGFVPTTWYSGSAALGHGATSQVYQSQLDVVKGLAFKKLSRQCQISEDQHYASLVSEMLILKAKGVVDHPNIAKLMAIAWEVPDGSSAVWPVLVSDRAQFGTLSEYCLLFPQGEPVVNQERLRLCIETARAILTLHSCNVIHGDVKPENIVLASGERGRVSPKLIDFGYSCFTQSQDQKLSLPKSEPWNAPEYDSNEGRFSVQDAKKADLFSFGLMCLWILSSVGLVKTWREGIEESRISAAREIETLKSSGLLQSWFIESTKNQDAVEPFIKTFLQEICLSTLCEMSNRPDDFLDILKILERLDVSLSSPAMQLLKTALGALQLGPSPNISRDNLFQLLSAGRHRCFNVIESIEEIESGDYRVPQWIARCLQERTETGRCMSCRQSAAFELAICYRIGYGVRADRRMELANLTLASKTSLDVDVAIDAINIGSPIWMEELRGIDITRNIYDAMQEQNRLQEAEATLTGWIADRQKSLGSEHSSTIRLHCHFSNVLGALGKYREEEEYDRKIMQLSEKAFGRRSEAATLAAGNLARSLISLGKWEEAESLLKRVITTMSWSFEAKHPIVLAAKDSLALTYRYQGRLQKSCELQEQNLKMKRTILGHEHESTLGAMVKLASCYSELDRHKDAERLEEQCVNLRSKVLGKNHPETLHALGNLWITVYNQGQRQRGIQGMEQLIDKLQNVLGPQNPETLSGQSRLSNMYFRETDYEKAANLQTRILNLRIETTGADHCDTMTSCGDLANTFHQLGQLDQSECHYFKALEGRGKLLSEQTRQEKSKASVGLARRYANQKLWSEDESYEVQILSNLASLFREQGYLDESELLLQQIVQGMQRVLGPDREPTLSAVTALADVYTSQGKYTQAQELQSSVLTQKTEKYSESHQASLTIMADLARTYKHLEKWDEAEDMERRAYELAMNTLGQQHPLSAELSVDVAMTYMRKAKWTEAMEKILAAYEAIHKARGPAHPNALTVLGLMAECKKCQGDWTGAEQVEVEVLEGITACFGENCHQTLNAKSTLAETFWTLGRFSEAEELVHRVIEQSSAIFGSDDSRTLRYAQILSQWGNRSS